MLLNQSIPYDVVDEPPRLPQPQDVDQVITRHTTVQADWCVAIPNGLIPELSKMTVVQLRFLFFIMSSYYGSKTEITLPRISGQEVEAPDITVNQALIRHILPIDNYFKVFQPIKPKMSVTNFINSILNDFKGRCNVARYKINKSNWFIELSADYSNGLIYRLSPEGAERLLATQGGFTSLKLSTISNIINANAFHLYLALAQRRRYRGGIWRVSVAELRRLLGVEGQYRRYGSLRREYLDVALREINAVTDLRVEIIDTETKRRAHGKVDEITFRIISMAGENPAKKAEKPADASPTLFDKPVVPPPPPLPKETPPVNEAVNEPAPQAVPQPVAMPKPQGEYNVKVWGDIIKGKRQPLIAKMVAAHVKCAYGKCREMAEAIAQGYLDHPEYDFEADLARAVNEAGKRCNNPHAVSAYALKTLQSILGHNAKMTPLDKDGNDCLRQLITAYGVSDRNNAIRDDLAKLIGLGYDGQSIVAYVNDQIQRTRDLGKEIRSCPGLVCSIVRMAAEGGGSGIKRAGAKRQYANAQEAQAAADVYLRTHRWPEPGQVDGYVRADGAGLVRHQVAGGGEEAPCEDDLPFD